MVFGAGGFLGARICALFELSGQPARIVDETQSDTVPGATWQQADTTLIGQHLGWSPKISLEQSLADSWAGPG